MADIVSDAKKQLLTPDQVWELEKRRLDIEQAKVDASIKVKEIEVASEKEIASQKEISEMELLKEQNELKRLELETNERIATENNKVASEANKVGFWANIVNALKVVAYVILAIIYLVFTLISKKDDQAFELEDNYRAKESSKWSQRIFDRAKSFVDGLKA